MSIQMRLFSVLGALSVYAAIAPAQATPIEDKPSFPTLSYWDNWTDPQGVTHLTKCKMSTFHEDSIAPDSDKIMLSAPHEGPATVTMRVQPPHWKGGWNQSHQVQWVVPLSGIYFVKAMDGTSVELNPGDILLSEDLSPVAHGSDPAGHLSGNVGDDAVALQILQFGEATASHQPCQWQ